jgi:hypothetical protein
MESPSFIHDACTEKLHKLKVQWLPHKSSLATEKPMGPFCPPETNTFLFAKSQHWVVGKVEAS